MNIRQLLLGSGLLLGGSIACFQAPAQAAFGFKTNFEYDPSLSGSDRYKGNIFLQSVEVGDKTITDFSLINNAKIISGDVWTGGNTGAASADAGDRADGLVKEDATGSDIMQVLNNKNLNNIVDTEDRGNFAMNLFFEKAVDNVFVWERGQNSQIGFQAIDKEGKLLGNFVELPKSNPSNSPWVDAGYRIDTQEIGGSQAVGSIGLNLEDFGVTGPIAGLRVISESSYNGPDWKIAGSVAEPAETPEPSAILGLGLLAGGVMIKRRRSPQTQA